MQIPFYFDYACPWAYLGSCRVEDYFRDLDLEIDYRPVRLAVLREPGVKGGLPPGERKRRYYRADLLQWAAMVGAELSPQAGERRPDTRLLLCAAWVALEAGRFDAFHDAAFRARWAEARPVDDAAVVQQLLEKAGLPGDASLARARSPEIGQRLEQETQAAIERGVFGVPTLFVGDEMFWGNDRFELAHWVAAKRLGRAGRSG